MKHLTSLIGAALVLAVTASGALEGLGKGFSSLVISLIRYLAIIPLAFVLSRLLGAVGVWHSFWMTELLAAGVSLALYRMYLIHR